jgi:hypothetical protein
MKPHGIDLQPSRRRNRAISVTKELALMAIREIRARGALFVRTIDHHVGNS